MADWSQKRHLFLLPFAVTVMVAAIILLLTGLGRLSMATKSEDWPSGVPVTTFVVGIIMTFIGVSGILALLCYCDWPLYALAWAFRLGIPLYLIDLVMQWFQWGLSLNGEHLESGEIQTDPRGKWKPTGAEWFGIAFFTLYNLIMMLLLYRIAKGSIHITNIRRYNGSGWRYKSIYDLQAEQ